MTNKQAGGMPFALLDVPGAQNIRDLGGYAGAGGRPIRPLRFIRGASLAGVGPDGVAALRRYGVALIVDLRSSMELRAAPCPLAGDAGIAFEHVPMLDYINSSAAQGDFTGFSASLEELYTGLLDNAQGSFRRVFELFADRRYRTCFFGCTAGKDRTGVTAMLLLALAGVAPDVIAEDYSWSSRLLKLPEDAEPDGRFPAYLGSSPAHTMLAVLRHLDRRYGGAEAYLLGAGVGAEQLGAVREKLFAA